MAPTTGRASFRPMSSVEQLRDAYHELEAALDANAREFAGRFLVVTREHLGETCLTAQRTQLDEDARFDFREFIDAPFDALRFVAGEKTLTLEFRREGEDEFSERMEWAFFDTLSKLLILEAFAVADSGAR